MSVESLNMTGIWQCGQVAELPYVLVKMRTYAMQCSMLV